MPTLTILKGTGRDYQTCIHCLRSIPRELTFRRICKDCETLRHQIYWKTKGRKKYKKERRRIILELIESLK